MRQIELQTRLLEKALTTNGQFISRQEFRQRLINVCSLQLQELIQIKESQSESIKQFQETVSDQEILRAKKHLYAAISKIGEITSDYSRRAGDYFKLAVVNQSLRQQRTHVRLPFKMNKLLASGALIEFVEHVADSGMESWGSSSLFFSLQREVLLLLESFERMLFADIANHLENYQSLSETCRLFLQASKRPGSLAFFLGQIAEVIRGKMAILKVFMKRES